MTGTIAGERRRPRVNLAVAVVAGAKLAMASARGSAAPIVVPPHPQWHDGFNHCIVTLSASPVAARAAARLAGSAGVNEVAGRRCSRTTCTRWRPLCRWRRPPTTPGFSDVWYLQSTGQAIEGWPSLAGASAGITVG